MKTFKEFLTEQNDSPTWKAIAGNAAKHAEHHMVMSDTQKNVKMYTHKIKSTSGDHATEYHKWMAVYHKAMATHHDHLDPDGPDTDHHYSEYEVHSTQVPDTKEHDSFHNGESKHWSGFHTR